MAKKCLWLLIDPGPGGYDTYDSAVVIAETEKEARMIHPRGSDYWDGKDEHGSWCNSSEVEVHYLGELAYENYCKYSSGVVCASFNAA
jgi:hypothetical protein